MTSSDLICTDCLHGKHSHHSARWGGICIGCACAYQPLSDAADGTGTTDSHEGAGEASPTSDAGRDLAAPSTGPVSSRPSPGATDPRIEAMRQHPPTYTKAAIDPLHTLYCPPCSEARGEWVTWTPEHILAALAGEQ